jgi:hypothetical protein
MIVECRDCQHQFELDPAQQAMYYGADLPAPYCAECLKCSQCGGRRVDFVVTGAREFLTFCGVGRCLDRRSWAEP